jgi:hypothetical protein
MYQTIHNGEEQNNHHKGKRPESSDISRPKGSHTYDRCPSKRAEPQHVADRALRAMSSTDQNGIGCYGNRHPADHYGVNWPPHATPIQPHGLVNRSRPTTSDPHLAEALQRETQSQDIQSRNTETQSSTNGDNGHKIHDQNSHNIITVFGTKRKRNFSKRTKTGCMTRRKRRKKCDEGRPICESPPKWIVEL